MSVAEEVVLDRFRQLRDDDPDRFALAPLVIVSALDMPEEARVRALERHARVAAEK